MATRNEIAWEKIFEVLNVVNRVAEFGYCDISTDQIKEISAREPRLIAKHDHKQNLPKVFSENNFSLLTTSNSSYRVGAFDIFLPIEEIDSEMDQVSEISWHGQLQTLDVAKITGEPAALHAALASGIMKDFVGEEVVQTISGRMRTSDFKFTVKTYDGTSSEIFVKGAQIEIDAGYEGNSGVYLVEAKNHGATNFNLRQIYYPFRFWSERVSKPISTIFMTYSNDIFDLSEYLFDKLDVMDSARLVNRKRYMLKHAKFDWGGLLNFVELAERNGLRPLNPFGAPIPQSNDFRRVVDLVSLLLDSPMSKNDLLDNYTLQNSFDPRQVDYYVNAGRYLGLVIELDSNIRDEDGHRLLGPTDLAEEIFKLPINEKYFEIAKLVLQSPSIRKYILYFNEHHKWPQSSDMLKIAESAGDLENHINTETFRRRAQSLLAWAKWVQGLQGL